MSWQDYCFEISCVDGCQGFWIVFGYQDYIVYLDNIGCVFFFFWYNDDFMIFEKFVVGYDFCCQDYFVIQGGVGCFEMEYVVWCFVDFCIVFLICKKRSESVGIILVCVGGQVDQNDIIKCQNIVVIDMFCFG